jgi:hypothetical protein
MQQVIAHPNFGMQICVHFAPLKDLESGWKYWEGDLFTISLSGAKRHVVPASSCPSLD